MTGIQCDRRGLLASGAAFVAWTGLGGWPAAALAAGRSIPKPPVARVEPVVDDYFGTRVTDRYRWMENPKDPDWMPFLKGQQAHTQAVLETIPGRAALGRRISQLTGDAAATKRVTPAGRLLFYEQRPVGADNFKLFVRGADGATRTLIDPTVMGSADAHVSLDWWVPSGEGRYVAYGLSPAGSEASVLHVMDVASGRVLPERIEKTDWGVIAWLPDSSGFFYLQFTGERGTPSLYQNSQARLHRLGTDPAADAVVLKRGSHSEVAIESGQVPIIAVNAGSKTALAFVVDIRRETAIYSTPVDALAAGEPAWRKVADFDDLVTGTALIGDRLYLLSNKGSPRGRVLLTSASAPDLKAAREVMPEGEAVIEAIDGARDGVFATIMDGGVQRISRIGLDGTVTALAMPFEGAVAGLFAAPDRDGAYANLAGWLQPSAIYSIEPGGRIVDTGINPPPPIDTSPYEARRGFATARDGTRIPYSLIYRKGIAANGANPTLVNAYGAYQLSSTPSFSPRILPFLDAGGVYAVANVRGGGEYGREWHMAGRKETKPNTWRDLIDVCEHLVAERVTAPRHLAIMGGSAGGMTVGQAMNERPDLFAGVVNAVGWVNPIRYSAEQNVADIDEWGPIADAASFRVMYAMDAYQGVRDGVSYPAVLCQTGATDPRVAPWHMAKYAARLQAAMPSGNPVLLRVDFDAGHGVGSTRSQSDALYADAFAFVLWRTGASGFQPG